MTQALRVSLAAAVLALLLPEVSHAQYRVGYGYRGVYGRAYAAAINPSYGGAYLGARGGAYLSAGGGAYLGNSWGGYMDGYQSGYYPSYWGGYYPSYGGAYYPNYLGGYYPGYAGYYPYFTGGYYPGYTGGYYPDYLATRSTRYDFRRGYQASYYGPELTYQPSSQPAITYQTYYTGPGNQPYTATPAAAPAQAAPQQPAIRKETSARVNADIRLPTADAELWIEGKKMDGTGTVRQFVSPPLDEGGVYRFKAKWTENDKPMERTREVKVKPGDNVTVDFTKPDAPAEG